MELDDNKFQMAVNRLIKIVYIKKTDFAVLLIAS